MMYHTIYSDERVALTPEELNDVHSRDDINGKLLQKLVDLHSSKCNANGYVKPNSIELVARSAGAAENGRFTGNYVYDCKMKCDVLYPKGGMVMNVQVIKVTKMGLYAVFEEAIRFLIPRDIHIGNKRFDSIREGEVIKVRLERSEIKANGEYITAIGKIVGDDGEDDDEEDDAGAGDVEDDIVEVTGEETAEE